MSNTPGRRLPNRSTHANTPLTAPTTPGSASTAPGRIGHIGGTELFPSVNYVLHDSPGVSLPRNYPPTTPDYDWRTTSTGQMFEAAPTDGQNDDFRVYLKKVKDTATNMSDANMEQLFDGFAPSVPALQANMKIFFTVADEVELDVKKYGQFCLDRSGMLFNSVEFSQNFTRFQKLVGLLLYFFGKAKVPFAGKAKDNYAYQVLAYKLAMGDPAKKSRTQATYNSFRMASDVNLMRPSKEHTFAEMFPEENAALDGLVVQAKYPGSRLKERNIPQDYRDGHLMLLVMGYSLTANFQDYNVLDRQKYYFQLGGVSDWMWWNLGRLFYGLPYSAVSTPDYVCNFLRNKF